MLCCVCDNDSQAGRRGDRQATASEPGFGDRTEYGGGAKLPGCPRGEGGAAGASRGFRAGRGGRRGGGGRRWSAGVAFSSGRRKRGTRPAEEGREDTAHSTGEDPAGVGGGWGARAGRRGVIVASAAAGGVCGGQVDHLLRAARKRGRPAGRLRHGQHRRSIGCCCRPVSPAWIGLIRGSKITKFEHNHMLHLAACTSTRLHLVHHRASERRCTNEQQ